MLALWGGVDGGVWLCVSSCWDERWVGRPRSFVAMPGVLPRVWADWFPIVHADLWRIVC